MLSCSMSDQQSSGVISAEKLIELKAEGIKVVDIRTKGEYDQGHIPLLFVYQQENQGIPKLCQIKENLFIQGKHWPGVGKYG